MPKLSQQTIEPGIKSVREVGRQECIYYTRPDDSPVDYAAGKNPEDTPFTETIRNALGSWVSALLKHLVEASTVRLRQRDHHTVWLIDSKGDDKTGFKSSRGQMVVLNHQELWECTYPDQKGWRSHQGALTRRAL